MRGINELNGGVFLLIHHVPIWCFLKVILVSLSFYYPQVSEILFDGRHLHPTQVDKPWKNACDNKLWKDAPVTASFSVKGTNAARYELLLSCCLLTL